MCLYKCRIHARIYIFAVWFHVRFYSIFPRIYGQSIMLIRFANVLFTVFRTYKLPMSRILPFPKKNDQSSAHDYPSGTHVLAVYPGTTALYKATVVNPPQKVIIRSITFKHASTYHMLIFIIIWNIIFRFSKKIY